MSKKSYIYELTVDEKRYNEEYGNYSVQVKRFLGNDVNVLKERFEMWFIKSPYDREDITVHVGYVQHAGY